MKTAGEIDNTETWSANLHMTEAQLPAHRREFENEKTEPIEKDQTVAIRMEHQH